MTIHIGRTALILARPRTISPPRVIRDTRITAVNPRRTRCIANARQTRTRRAPVSV